MQPPLYKAVILETPDMRAREFEIQRDYHAHAERLRVFAIRTGHGGELPPLETHGVAYQWPHSLSIKRCA